MWLPESEKPLVTAVALCWPTDVRFRTRCVFAPRKLRALRDSAV